MYATIERAFEERLDRLFLGPLVFANLKILYWQSLMLAKSIYCLMFERNNGYLKTSKEEQMFLQKDILDKENHSVTRCFLMLKD